MTYFLTMLSFSLYRTAVFILQRQVSGSTLNDNSMLLPTADNLHKTFYLLSILTVKYVIYFLTLVELLLNRFKESNAEFSYGQGTSLVALEITVTLFCGVKTQHMLTSLAGR